MSDQQKGNGPTSNSNQSLLVAVHVTHVSTQPSGPQEASLVLGISATRREGKGLGQCALASVPATQVAHPSHMFVTRKAGCEKQ